MPKDSDELANMWKRKNESKKKYTHFKQITKAREQNQTKATAAIAAANILQTQNPKTHYYALRHRNTEKERKPKHTLK